ncbi:MAG: LapA family protein [Wenzhouxiangellaceae bacterium]
MLRWALVALLLVGVSFGAALGALNPDSVSVDLVVFDWHSSLGTVLVVAVGSGLIVGVLLGILFQALGRRRCSRNPGSASGEVPDA